MNIFRILRTATVVVVMVMLFDACSRRQPPVARPAPPPPPGATTPTPAPEPPEPVAEPVVIPPEPLAEDTFAARSLEELNRESPLKPVFFRFDSSEVDIEGQRALNDNAALLGQYATWTVTIEGHCDERGTAEYNLGLGERRALAARDYLVSLGVSPDRIRIVSYGKEFPFDPGHTEEAWAQNRRAHFVITAK